MEQLNEKSNIFKITPESKLWPSSLNNLSNPPAALYCKGNIDLLSRPIVGIVGTRDCTRYGVEVAKKFGKQLAELGIVTVSGLANGIDTAAHLGAFPLTIAVLGNGVNQCYPANNAALQQRIIDEGGLVISEYEPDAKSTKYSFPQRNRIVAALSRALIIVEADVKSGALITKNYALELGVEVFAVPGPITSYASRGTNDIIKTAACAIITDIQDVLDCFGMTVKGEESNVVQISFEAKTVLDILRADEIHFDDLLNAIKLSPQKLLNLLTTMELDGLIKKLPSNFYAAATGKKFKFKEQNF